MDGGGRVLEPLIAGFPGDAVGRFDGRAGRAASGPLAKATRWAMSPRTAFGFRRRRSVSVPLAQRLPRLTGTFLTLGFFAAVGITGSAVGDRLPDMKGAHLDIRNALAKAVGFGVGKVTISGLSVLGESEILAVAGIGRDSTVPFLPVAEMRERLEALPLVKSAAVRKLYPGEVAITIVEREAYALWQKAGELYVVAQDGTVVDKLRDARLASLPLVVGDRANERANEYLALLDAAGSLRTKIRAGMLVSGRRWDLKMANGLDVRLPEEDAAGALKRLAKLDREQHILDKDVLAIDLRQSDRIVVRLSEEAAAARADTLKKKPARGAKGIET